MTRIDDLSKNGTLKDFKFGEDLILGKLHVLQDLMKRGLLYQFGKYHCWDQNQQKYTHSEYRIDQCVI